MNHLTILSCSRLFCFFNVAISAIPLTTAGLRETYSERRKMLKSDTDVYAFVASGLSFEVAARTQKISVLVIVLRRIRSI